MSENRTPKTAHGAGGRTRLRSTSITKPDTLVLLPDGRTMVLRRSEQELPKAPLFRKFNPKKFDTATGKPLGKGRGGSSGRFQPPSRIPFTKFLLTAFLVHHAISSVTGLWRRWRARRQRQLQAPNDWQDDWEGDDQALQHPEVAAADARLRMDMLPAMMRAALPKPFRRTAAAQAAHMQRTRPRHLPTAQALAQPAQGVRRKQPGKLGKLDAAVQRQARALAVDQQRTEHLQLEAGQRLALLNDGSGAAEATSAGDPHQAQGQPALGLQRPTGPTVVATQPVKKR